MTTTEIGHYRWSSEPPTAPVRPDQFRKTHVVGEVKPHNPRGIAAGINQLVRSTARRPTALPQLITYRQSRASRTQFEVLAADVVQLQNAIAGRKAGRHPAPTVSTWYLVGTIPVPQATRTIELWQCPTLFGNEVEQLVRDAYAARVGIPRFPVRPASRTGADIEHELLEMAEFFRELAAELEGEAVHQLS